MFNMLLIMIFSMFIMYMMFLINLLMSKKTNFNREKMSPFECGYDPMNTQRLPFSMHFFLISLLFLIFDIEITLLIPSIPMVNYFNKMMLMSIMMFILLLIIGLYIEYLEKSIDWKM